MPRSAVRAWAASQHLLGERRAAELDLGSPDSLVRLAQLLADRELAVGAAHDLDQVVLGDRVARLAVEDVVEPRLGAALVAQALEELERVGDAASARRCRRG